MATGAECGANAVIAQRARDGPRAYQANRHRVCIRTRSGVQRLTISIPIGAAFGHDTRTHTLRRYSYVAGPSRPHERSCSGCRAAPRSRSFGRAAHRDFGRNRGARTEVSVANPGARPGFRPKARRADRGWFPVGRGRNHGGAHRAFDAPEPKPRRARRRKARSAGAGFRLKSAVRGTETTATDHYSDPDHFMCPPFLSK